MTTTDLSIHTLDTDAFVAVPLGTLLQAHIEKLSRTWQNFLALPEEERCAFPYLPDTTNSGSGYEPPDADKQDFKHVFHAQHKHKEWLYEQAEKVGSVTALELVDDTLRLLHELRPVLTSFTDMLEHEYPVGTLTQDLLAGYHECIIRLLHYPGGVHIEGEESAVQHVDKGAFTGHLWEDLPGVERLTMDGKWKSFPVHTGQVLMFPAMRLQYRTESKIKGLCHRVVTTAEASRLGRNSIVLFGNFANTPYYDKKRCRSMQVHPPGFNYEMSHEEFRKLFRA